MRRLVALAAVCAASLTVAPALSGQSRGAKAPVVTGGNGTLYIGTYKAEVEIYDEATEKLTGTIKLKSGIPRSITFSPDRTRFYALDSRLEQIEVVDVATRQTIDSFKLTAGNKLIRVSNLQPDPANKYLILMYRAATKLIDRWEIGAAVFLVYDLTTHTITRTIPWTIDPEPTYYSTSLRFSPDGKLLYVFGNEITILDAATLAPVDVWDLSTPADPVMGRFDQGPSDDSADPQGKVTSLFTMRDTVAHRKVLVVGEIDLAAKTIDTFTLGPAPDSGGLSFTMSPDRQHAVVLRAEIGRHELWTIDMAARAVTKRVEVPTRTRMQMRTSSTGLLYVYEAGSTIEVYSADATTRLRTIQLDSDMMYATFVIVPGAR